MGLFTWIVVGAIAGWLANLIVKGSGAGLVGNIVLGILGALVGGWLAGAIFNVPRAVTGFNLGTIFVAFLGAVIVLLVVRMLTK